MRAYNSIFSGGLALLMASLADREAALMNFRKAAYSPGGRNLRHRATRNNNPAYRKSIWPEGKVAKPGRMG